MPKNNPKKTLVHKWVFPARFRANGYGEKGSALACKRLKEAVSEIKKTAKTDPVRGAEGTVLLMEKIWPAFQHIDTSTGALGTAVQRAMEALMPILIDAPAERTIRDKWLLRLWEALMDDGVSYLDQLGKRWGEVCGSKEVASAWADDSLFLARRVLTDPAGGMFKGTTACLSSLLAAERYQELLELLASSRYKFWHEQKFGVFALLNIAARAVGH